MLATGSDTWSVFASAKSCDPRLSDPRWPNTKAKPFCPTSPPAPDFVPPGTLRLADEWPIWPALSPTRPPATLEAPTVTLTPAEASLIDAGTQAQPPLSCSPYCQTN